MPAPTARLSPPRDFTAVLTRAVPLFLLLASVALAAVFLVHLWQTRRITADAARDERRFVPLLQKSVNGDLDIMLSDLRVLENANSLRRFLDDRSPDNKAALAQAFRSFAAAKGLYDQIRLLDAAGMEIVRVNAAPDGATIVPEAELQSKADRYYFRDAIGLASGQIYLSPMDLNIERGVVETPHKPMIRAAMAVFDSAGRKCGVIVLNYLSGQLLAHIKDLAAGSLGRVSLVNADGYWLLGPDPAEEWGFMFPQGRDRTFAAAYPEAWKAIAAGEAGQVATEAGIVTYARINPLSGHGPAMAGTPRWHAVSVLGPAEQAALTRPLDTVSLAAGGLFLGLLALASWLAASHKLTREQAVAALRERERLYRTLAENIPNGAVFLLDPVMRCLLAEGKGLAAMGLTPRQECGDDAQSIFPPEVRGVVETHFREALSGRETSFEMLWNKETYQAHVVPVLGADGRIFAEMLMTSNITERKALEEQLRVLATVDALTGLFNRRHFLESLAAAVLMARRTAAPLTLCLLDIDKFKTVNDAHGHVAGDTVLAALGSVIRQCVRATDIAGRYGGDEFFIALPDTTPQAALVVIERIGASLAATPFRNERGEEFYVTSSFGLAGLEPDQDADGLMEAADKALYSVKQSGRGKACIDTCTEEGEGGLVAP